MPAEKGLWYVEPYNIIRKRIRINPILLNEIKSIIIGQDDTVGLRIPVFILVIFARDSRYSSLLKFFVSMNSVRMRL